MLSPLLVEQVEHPPDLVAVRGGEVDPGEVGIACAHGFQDSSGHGLLNEAFGQLDLGFTGFFQASLEMVANCH